MKQIFIILSFFTFYLAIGQHKVSFFIDGGISKIKSKLIPITATISSIYSNSTIETSTVSTKFEPTARMGFNYLYESKTAFCLGFDLLFTIMKAEEKILAKQDKTNTESYNYNSIYYIGLPLHLGYRIKKLSVHIGPAFLFPLYAKGYQNGISYQTPITLTYSTNYERIKTEKLDVGLNANIGYDIIKQFSIYLNGYWGFTNIIKDDIHIKYKNRQITLGLKYNVFESAKREISPQKAQ